MSATTAAILRAARAKIERPECWTKGQYARGRTGRDVYADGARAVSWCMVGALYSTKCQTVEYLDAVSALKRAYKSDHDPVVYNDAPERTHAEVLAAFDRAIEAEERAP